MTTDVHIESSSSCPDSDIRAYVCCDSPFPPFISNNNDGSINNGTDVIIKTDYLDDVDCVLYCNSTTYQDCGLFGNYYGAIILRVCQEPHDGLFAHPQPVWDNNKVPDNFRFNFWKATPYQCCKAEYGPHKLYYQDSEFIKTIIPQLVLSSIAVLVSMTLIVSLALPTICRKFRSLSVSAPFNRSFGNPTPASAAVSIDMGGNTNSNNNSNNIASGDNTRRQQLRNRHRSTTIQRQQQCASSAESWNLYLVFLAIPDVAINL